MSNEKFVYVTYIDTTPEKTWQALLDGEMTRQYWQHDNVSDWQPGSTLGTPAPATRRARSTWSAKSSKACRRAGWC